MFRTNASSFQTLRAATNTSQFALFPPRFSQRSQWKQDDQRRQSLARYWHHYTRSVIITHVWHRGLLWCRIWSHLAMVKNPWINSWGSHDPDHIRGGPSHLRKNIKSIGAIVLRARTDIQTYRHTERQTNQNPASFCITNVAKPSASKTIKLSLVLIATISSSEKTFLLLLIRTLPPEQNHT